MKIRKILYLVLFCGAIFSAFFAIPLLSMVLFEFASRYIYPVGILAIIFFVLGIVFWLLVYIKERHIDTWAISGILLIILFIYLAYPQVRYTIKYGESIWSPLGSITEILVKKYKQEAKKPVGEEISQLVFAREVSDYYNKKSRQFIVLKYDGGQEKILNRIDLPINNHFAGFVNAGRSFIYYQQESETRARHYYIAEVGKSDAATAISEEKANLLLGAEYGKISPDNKKFLSFVVIPGEEFIYVYVDYDPSTHTLGYVKEFLRLKINSGSFSPVITHYEDFRSTPLWLDDNHILYVEKLTSGFYKEILVKKNNIFTGTDEPLFKVVGDSAEIGKISVVDSQHLLLSMFFGSKYSKIYSQNGKIIFVPSATPKADVYLYSLRDDSIVQLTDTPLFSSRYDIDSFVLLPDKSKFAFYLSNGAIYTVKLTKPYDKKEYFTNQSNLLELRFLNER